MFFKFNSRITLTNYGSVTVCGTINIYGTWAGNEIIDCPFVFVAVTNITDVPSTATTGTPLTLAGTVVPADATNQTIVWSVYDAGTTGATIANGNILNATAAGIATVRATIINGASESSNYIDIFNITVSGGASTSAPELASAPPLKAWIRNDMLHVTGLTIGEVWSVYSVSGALVYRSVAINDEADIALRARGVYIVQAGERTVRVAFE